jgi:predicted porin
MKFKTTAIAMAVAGVVAAPVAVQAGADEIYASARIGVWGHKDGGENNTEVKSFSSRFGAKGETDLGNGLTSFGRFEWDIDFQNESGDKRDAAGNVTTSGNRDSITKRHMYVGLKGDFGSVLVGQTYQTFYNFVVGPNDNPWWHSGYSMVNYRGRTDRAITYAGSSGDFNFGATAYLVNDPSDHVPDQFELGGSMGIGDMTLGLAYQWTANDTSQGSVGNDDGIVGAALTGISFGMVNLGLGVQSQDKDISGLVDASIGNAYAHVEVLSADKNSAASFSGDDETHASYTLGYTQTLGRKTLMYYEANYTDNDSNTKNNHSAIMAVLKYDII